MMYKQLNSADRHTPILVLDSGVGGLSVVAEIQQHCPHLSIRYLADNAALPYGDKSESWLIERVARLVQSVCDEEAISMVVIACNTASTVVLPALRQLLTIPVVGVVPAIKPAVARSTNKHIGLLATPGTVKRHYTQQLIEQFAPNCEVTLVGTTVLVTQAERKLAGQSVQMEALQEAVQPLFESESLDTVVLGCTHFPLLKEELKRIAPRSIKWIDSGQAIARRVESLAKAETTALTQPVYHALCTAPLHVNVEIGLSQYGFLSSHRKVL